MNWIPLRELRLNDEIEHRKLQGVKVDVLVSPYDIPEAVRGDFIEGKNRFVIEFKYISEESTRERLLEPNVKVRIGKNSSRLYAIDLDMKALDASAVSLRVQVAEALRNVLTHLIQQPVSAVRQKNYKLAKDVIEQNETRILQTV